MKNKLWTLAAVLTMLAVVGKFYAVPALAQARAAMTQDVSGGTSSYYYGPNPSTTTGTVLLQRSGDHLLGFTYRGCCVCGLHTELRGIQRGHLRPPDRALERLLFSGLAPGLIAQAPAVNAQSLYGSNSLAPAIATPSGVSVCRMRMVEPCAASTSGRRL